MNTIVVVASRPYNLSMNDSIRILGRTQPAVAHLMLAALLAPSLGACTQSAPPTEDYRTAPRAGYGAAADRWDASSEPCAEGPNWRMTLDAEAGSLAFDDSVDAACPTQAFWSATMTLTGTNHEISWFTSPPYRPAFSQPTSEFIASLAEAFTTETVGHSNAILHWEDTDSGADLSAPVHLAAR